MRPENRISLPPMRSWQSRTVDLIRQAIKDGHRRIVVQSPTGAGKTALAANLFAGTIAKGKRPIFTVPDITLVEQTLKSFECAGIHDIGVIQADHLRTDREAQVQIASVQSLIRRELPDVDLIVVDECHVMWQGLLTLMAGPVWADKIIIGLSATPWSRGMGLHWSKLIIGATIQELIDDKILCGFRIFAPDEDVDLSRVHIVKGEYDEGEASSVMREARIVADVVKTWQERWNQDRTFMFCVDRAHARTQQAKFEEAGIPFGYIDGTMSLDERKTVFEAFRERRIKGISSVGCLSRGVDEDVWAIIDAAPTNSEASFVQKIGRGLRNPEGNGKVLTILDHAGNTLRLGMVTDIHYDKLDCRKPGDKSVFGSEFKAAKPRKCPKCKLIIAAGKTRCSFCFHELPVISKVQHEEGRLIEFNSARKPKKQYEYTHEEKQRFYSGFLGLAEERGHSEGWAAHRYRSKMGTWPNGLKKEPSEPSFEVLQFDKHERIKWAKSKQKEAKTKAVSA